MNIVMQKTFVALLRCPAIPYDFQIARAMYLANLIPKMNLSWLSHLYQ